MAEQQISKPWDLGQLPGKVRANPVLVSWYFRDRRPGMGGYRTVERRFPSEIEGLEAAAMPLRGAYRVAAHYADRVSPVRLLLDRRAS